MHLYLCGGGSRLTWPLLLTLNQVLVSYKVLLNRATVFMSTYSMFMFSLITARTDMERGFNASPSQC